MITYNSYPWIMFSEFWLSFGGGGGGGGGSFEIGRLRSRGWKSFGRRWTRRLRRLENIHMQIT